LSAQCRATDKNLVFGDNCLIHTISLKIIMLVLGLLASWFDL
jgi:hypothetical protein